MERPKPPYWENLHESWSNPDSRIYSYKGMLFNTTAEANEYYIRDLERYANYLEMKLSEETEKCSI